MVYIALFLTGMAPSHHFHQNRGCIRPVRGYGFICKPVIKIIPERGLYSIIFGKRGVVEKSQLLNDTIPVKNEAG